MVPILLVSCVLVFLLGWRVLKWAWLEPKKLEKRLREQGFRGNPYKLLYGDFKEITTSFEQANSNPLNLSDDILPRVIPHFLGSVKRYGQKSYLWYGPKPSVLIMEPDLIKEVTHKMQVFQKPLFNPLLKLLAEGLVIYEGDKWAKHRKLLNPAFHMEKLKLMLPAFYESAREMLSKWEAIASQKGPVEVDVWPNLLTLTGDVISRTAFGSNHEEGRRIFELQREQAEHLIMASRSAFFPGMRFLPTKRNMRMKQIAKEVDDLIREIINARLESMRAGRKSGENLLGILLEENGSHGNKKLGISTNDVIQECKLFYFAGQETTSVLLVWTMILLSRYQDWQSRAREEVLHNFGTNKPEFEGLNRLKIVNMILHEVLRLYPPIAFLSRKIVEETKLGDTTLPAGVLVTLPAILMHHDTKIWGDDAKEFNPERFAEGVSHATTNQAVFFPFGSGPRICIGQNFAMLEAKMAMAMILQRFSFELSPSFSHAPRLSITLQPQFGAHLILHKL